MTFPWLRVIDTAIGKRVMDVGDSSGRHVPWKPNNRIQDIDKRHLAYNYYHFTYRYLDAAQRLRTIVADTRKMCEEMRDLERGPALNRDFRFQAQRFFQHYGAVAPAAQ